MRCAYKLEKKNQQHTTPITLAKVEHDNQKLNF
jgi:hypothetical protein